MKSKCFSLASFTLIASLLIILAGCGGAGSGFAGGHGDPVLNSITVGPSGASIVVGSAQQFTATGNYSDQTTKDLTASAVWTSSDTAKATITSGGKATAVAAGQITITATSGSVKGTTTLTVTAAVQPIVVAINEQNPSVASAGTFQFTAKVTNDSSNKGVTWTVTPSGTISATGLLTAPTVTTQTTLTVKATSVTDSTKSDSTTVTVTPVVTCGKVGTITSVTPVTMYFADNGKLLTGFTLNGSCFAAGQTLHISSRPDTKLPDGVSSTQIDEVIQIGTAFYNPGFIRISLTSVDGTANSNTVAIAFVGNQPTLVLDAAGNLYHLDQAQGKATSAQNGYVREFSVTGKTLTSFNVGGNQRSIAFDDADNLIFVGTAAWSVTGVSGGGGNDGVATMGVAASGGMLFGAQPDAKQAFSFLASQTEGGNPKFFTGAAGPQPWSVATATVNGELDGVVIDVEGDQLFRFGLADMTQQGIALPITGCTPASQLPYGMGGWQIVTFSSPSPAAGQAAVLCEYDKVLILYDLVTMTETDRVTLTGIPFRIAADATHGNVIIANADTDAILTRFASVNALATGTIIPGTLSATTPLLAVGFAVSPDGSKLDVCEQATCNVIDNN